MPWQPMHIETLFLAALASPAGGVCAAAESANETPAAAIRILESILILLWENGRRDLTTEICCRMRFNGSAEYISTDDLTLAVNAAITLQRPLLVKGEPGTGKTMLAVEVAKALGVPLLEWHIKSTSKAQQGLHAYGAVSRPPESTPGRTRAPDTPN